MHTKLLMILCLVVGMSDAFGAGTQSTAQAKKIAGKKVKDTFDLDKELAKARFKFEMDGRRDPFGTPLSVDNSIVKKPGPTRAGTPVVIAGASLEDEKQRLDLAKNKLAEAQNLVTDGKTPEASRALGEAEASLAVRPTHDELTPPYQALVKQARKLAGQTRDYRDQQLVSKLTTQFEEAQQLLGAGEYELVIERCLLATGTSTRNAGPEVKELVGQLADLQRRAELRQEFSVNTIVVDGTATGDGPGASIVNGELIRLGGRVPMSLKKKPRKTARGGTATTEYIPDATVSEITAHMIVIDYKGEQIEFPIHDD